MTNKLYTITLVLSLSWFSHGRENSEYFDTKNDLSYDCKHAERVGFLHRYTR